MNHAKHKLALHNQTPPPPSRSPRNHEAKNSPTVSLHPYTAPHRVRLFDIHDNTHLAPYTTKKIYFDRTICNSHIGCRQMFQKFKYSLRYLGLWEIPGRLPTKNLTPSYYTTDH
jgi:hypothetical protein